MTELVANQRWLPIFLEFLEELRISSKEVSSSDARGVKLNLWGSQRLALESVCAGMEVGIRDFMFLKSRQLGITTIFLAIDVFWMAMFPNTTGALVTESAENRKKFRQTIEQYVKSMPSKYRGAGFQIQNNNDAFMTFTNGSRLDMLVAGTKNKETWGQGQGYSLAHASEVSSYGSEKGISSFKEALAEHNPNRLFIWESTANGMNHYKEMWDEYGRDTFAKKRTFIGWWSKELNEIKKTDGRFAGYGQTEPNAEERDLIDFVKSEYNFEVTPEKLAWYRWKSSDGSKTMQDLFQNQPWTASQAFVLSGHSFFQVRTLQKDFERCEEELYKAYAYHLGNDFWDGQMEKIDDPERAHEVVLRVYEEPVEGATYSIGCDPALGRNDNKDRHAIQVMRCFADKLIQVAEYADNNVETRQAAWVLAHLAGAYNNCVVNVELTGGHGHAVMAELDHLRQRMVVDPKFQTEVEKGESWENFLSNARWYIYKKADSFSGGTLKGFESNHRTKVRMMNLLRDNYATGLIYARSAPLIGEMVIVVQDGSEIGAPGNTKDDRVFALALANLSWQEQIRMGMIGKGETYEKVMEEGYKELDNDKVFTSGLVSRFMASQEERKNMEPEDAVFLRDKGFSS